MPGVNLRGAHLIDADFKEADLAAAQLQGKEITVAGVTGETVTVFEALPAVVERTDFHYANLSQADFTACRFYGTKLEGAKLRGAGIYEAHLEEADWGSYVAGEEQNRNFYDSERAYRRLKQWYANAAMYDVAGQFFFREMTARRKMLKWRPNPLPRLWSKFISVIWGYGEKPERVVIWATTIIFGLAAAYFFWGTFNSSSFLDSLYYSAASFTALGYGSWAPQPTGWAKAMGAVEAFIGVFSMALFLVTFTRKMTR